MSDLLAVFDSGSMGLGLGVALLVILATLIIGLWMSQRAKSKYKLPPSPPIGSALLGHLSLMTRDDIQQELTRLSNELGGIFYLRVVDKLMVIVTDPELYRPFISRTEAQLQKSAWVYEPFRAMASPHANVSNLFAEPETSPYWKSVRKSLAPCFSSENIRKVFPNTVKTSHKLGDMWEAMDDLMSGKVSLNVEDWMRRATFDVLGSSGFGMDWGSLDAIGKHHEFLEALHDVLKEATKEAGDPFRRMTRKLLAPFMPEFARIEKSYATTFKMYDHILTTLRGREIDPEDQSFGAALLKLKDSESGEAMSDAQIAANICVMVVGGFDTSAYTLVWALYDIARHPEVQARLKAELLEHGLLQRPGAPPPRPLDYNDLPNLQYFNAVLKESMRVHHVSGGTLRATPNKPMEVGEYILPPKTTIWIATIAGMNTSRNWSKPDKFIPERFLNSEGGEEESSKQSGEPPMFNKSAYLPFLEGYRSCIGQNLAMMSTRTVLLSILSRFWLDVDWEKQGPAEKVEAEAYMAIVLVPKSGVHLKVRKHD